MYKEFNDNEVRMLRAMFKLARPATINEIGKWADGMSWGTAKETMKSLFEKGAVEFIPINERKYWQVVEI